MDMNQLMQIAVGTLTLGKQTNILTVTICSSEGI